MKKEQLKALDIKFKQLEELQNIYVRFEKRGLPLGICASFNNIIDAQIHDILRKYEKLALEDLRDEIKKREIELEGICIFQTDKLV